MMSQYIQGKKVKLSNNMQECVENAEREFSLSCNRVRGIEHVNIDNEKDVNVRRRIPR